jgi:hypothetical protein
LNPQARLDCGGPLMIRLFICHRRRIYQFDLTSRKTIFTADGNMPRQLRF